MKIVVIAAVVAQILIVVGTAHAGNVILPEPGSLALLGVGAGALAVGAWWRNRK